MHNSKQLKLLLYLLVTIVGSLSSTKNCFSQPFGLTQRTIVSGINIPLNNPETSNFTSPFNQTFSSPIYVTSPNDGTNRLFVVRQPGTVRVFNNVDDASTSSEFLNISSRISYGGEQGLLGFAFHPNYSSNGYFYVHYNAGSGSTLRSVISRFKVSSSNPNLADATSEKIILTVSQVNHDGQVYGNHKGGMIAFGLDNMLYIALGDGGSGGDAFNTGQDCADMLGSVLRINPSTSDSATPGYTVPNDNPFAGNVTYNCGLQQNALSRACGIEGGVDRQKICKEVWAYGLRNPWRFSFDRQTGALWLGDVGQGAKEEIDVVKAGDNLGWPVYEGNNTYRTVSGLPAQTFIPPVIDYPRSVGYAVTGGYVYRGQRVPSLYGKYIYSDYGTGNTSALTWTTNSSNRVVMVSSESLGTISNPSSFGEDTNADLYYVSIADGFVRRLGPSQSSGSTPIPTTLSATGLFANLTNLTPTPGMIEFDVNAPLWSDGATKRRWIALPGTQTITFNATEAYDFPIGTAIVKHFEKPAAARLETRVLFKHTQGWAGYTYKWNSNGTDASLISDSITENGWYYPSRTDCKSCHTTSAGHILGVRTRQLNKNFNYANATDNQLRSWNNIGLFSTNIGSNTSYEAYSAYDNAQASIESKARSYLAANCAMCHNPGEPRPGVIDLRYGISNQSMHIINESPSYGDLGITGALRLKPGDISKSIIYQRMDSLNLPASPDRNRMPPLASSIKDPTGLALLSAWIDSLANPGRPGAPGNLRIQ
jgi:uncharacterized repeat protein (TIGR03806 family)